MMLLWAVYAARLAIYRDFANRVYTYLNDKKIISWPTHTKFSLYLTNHIICYTIHTSKTFRVFAGWAGISQKGKDWIALVYGMEHVPKL